MNPKKFEVQGALSEAIAILQPDASFEDFRKFVIEVDEAIGSESIACSYIAAFETALFTNPKDTQVLASLCYGLGYFSALGEIAFEVEKQDTITKFSKKLIEEN